MSFSLPGEAILYSGRQIEPVVKFYGANTEQMPRLLTGMDADDKEVDLPRTPLSSGQFLEWRLDAHKAYKEAVAAREANPEQVCAEHVASVEAVRNKRWNRYADTATLWVRHPDRGGVIVPYDGKREGVVYDILLMIKPGVALVDHALPLEDGIYDAVRVLPHALELKPADIESLHGEGYAHGTVKNSEPWVCLADGNKDRVAEYDEALHELTGRDRYMTHFLGPVSQGQVTGSMWTFLGRGSCSDTSSFSSLVTDGGRLLGEVSVVGTTLEERLY